MKKTEIDKKNLSNSYIYISFCVAVAVLLIIGYIIHITVPDILDSEYISNNYIIPKEQFCAEKSEHVQYVTLTLLFPIIYVLIYKLLQKINIPLQKNKLMYIITKVTLIITLIMLLVLLFVFIQRCGFSWTTYVLESVACILVLQLFKDNNNNNKIYKFVIIIELLLIQVLTYLYINQSFTQFDYLAYHVDAYYYPILKITNGMTPYVDFAPLYGCYSYVFALLEAIFNNHSLLFFSIIVAFCVEIILINLGIFINKTIRNKIIALYTLIAVTFPLIIFHFCKNLAPYIQYMPHRVLFNSILLLYVSIYLNNREKKNKNLLQLFGFLICTCAIMWNLEGGIVTLIVWMALLIYEVLFYNSLKDKKTIIQILKIMVEFLGSILIAFLAIIMITYFRTKQIVGINDIILSQLLFYKYGFNMLKMKLIDLWILWVFIYLIGLAITLKKLFFLNSDKRNLFKQYATIFVLSILGIGVFSYYLGRSCDDTLMSTIYPGIILTGIYADIMIRRIYYIRDRAIRVEEKIIILIFLLIITVLSSLTIHNLVFNNNIHTYMNKKKLNSISVLNDFSKYDMDKFDLICLKESLYYKKYNIADKKKFAALVDIFRYNELDKIMEFICNTENNVIIDNGVWEFFKNNNSEKCKFLLENKYDVEEGQYLTVLIEKSN